MANQYLDYSGLTYFKQKNDILYAKKSEIPTDNINLANGAGYQTSSDVSTAIQNAMKDMSGIKFEVVDALPTSGASGTIYLVPNGSAGTNIYTEYIWINSRFEVMGSTDVDLTGYYNTTNLVKLSNDEIDEIFK